MNKKVFVFDFGLFILEELLLLLLHFVIPDYNDLKPLIYGITISLLLCVAVSSIFFNKYIKKTKISVKISAAALAVLLLLSSVATAFAATDFSSYYLISDEANLFDSSSFSGLTEKLQSVGSHTSWQIAVVTTNDNVSSSKMDSHYNKLYDNNRNYFESDCVMFVIDNASGNRIILTHGETESYFSDQRMNGMKSALKPYLQNGDMLNACYEFADKTQEFYDAGVPSNGSYNNHVEGTETETDKLKKENKLLCPL